MSEDMEDGAADDAEMLSAPRLFDYQRDGVAWFESLLDRGLGEGGILADEMGLGKTVQTLSVLQKRDEIQLALVAAPLSMVSVWEQEASIWAPRFKTLVLSADASGSTTGAPSAGGLATVAQKRREHLLRKKFCVKRFARYYDSGVGRSAASNTAAVVKPSRHKRGLLYITNLEFLAKNVNALKEVVVRKDFSEKEQQKMYFGSASLLKREPLPATGTLSGGGADDLTAESKDAPPRYAKKLRRKARDGDDEHDEIQLDSDDSEDESGDEGGGAADCPAAAGSTKGDSTQRTPMDTDGDRSPWDVLIIDEAHRIKDPSGTGRKAVVSVQAQHGKFLISGTPIANNLRDLWSLMDVCKPGILGNLATFTKHFIVPVNKGMLKNAQDWEVSVKEDLSSQIRAKTAPHILRRTKKEVNSPLNCVKKTDIVLWLDPTEAQRRFYRAVLGKDGGSSGGGSGRDAGGDHDACGFIRRARETGKMGTEVFRAIGFLKKGVNCLHLCEGDKLTLNTAPNDHTHAHCDNLQPCISSTL